MYFGTAQFKRYDAETKGTNLKTYVGIPEYMVPEVRSKRPKDMKLKTVADDKIYDSTGNVHASFLLSYS